MQVPNPAYIEELITLVNESPFPTHMNMRLAAIDLDTAEIELDLAEHHIQPYRIVHGGVVATLIDTATFWSAFLQIPEDAGLVNVDLKLNYLKPAVGGRLVTRGRCIQAGRTISYAEATVIDATNTTIAHGTSTLMTLPGKTLNLTAPKFR